MNRMILFGLLIGLTSVLVTGLFVKRGPQSGSAVSLNPSPSVTTPNHNKAQPSQKFGTIHQPRNSGDTSSHGRDNHNQTAQRDRELLRTILKQHPHGPHGSSRDSETIQRLDSSVDFDSHTKNILRQNRFQFRTLPADDTHFALPGLKGETHTLADYRGKWILVNFWASWCPPCREEMPSMQRLYQTLTGNNFTILAINLKESRKQARTFAEEFGLTFPILLDKDGTVGSNYGVFTIPTTWVIDPRGKPVARLLGPLDWSKPEIVETFRRLSSGESHPDTAMTKP